LRPLVLVAASWLGIVTIARSVGIHHGDHIAGSDLLALTVLPLFAVLTASLSLALLNGWRAWRGHQSTRRRALLERAIDDGWRDARVLATVLLAGKDLVPQQINGIRLIPGEMVHVQYTINSPHRGAVGERRSPTRIVLTNQRVISRTGQCWVSWWYSELLSLHLDLDVAGSVWAAFAGGKRLQFSGPAAPVLAVYITTRLFGARAVLEHPQFRRLQMR
jgi:hypothetical protein